MAKKELLRLAIIVFAIIGLSAMIPNSSFAAVTGKISGIVTDAETGEALPGVNVIIEGTTLGAATTATGEYFIIGIPPGIYSVTASIIGYQKMLTSDVQVMVNRTTTVDFQMKSTALEAGEEVTVTAERPTIIKDLTATASHVDARVFEVAPVQDVRNMMDLNAGILKDTQGNFIIRGGENNSLKFYVDGVSIENQDSREMGFRDVQRNLTQKYSFNILGVQEMEVVTGGFNAEYGDAQSGIVNIVTKEGGGAFHGEFRVEYSPPDQYHHGNYIYDPNVQVGISDWKDFSAWQTWNNSRIDPGEYADSIGRWYEKWKNIVTPSDDHQGGAYAYKEKTYKRALWGVGGPIRGNKLTFFFSGELRQNPSLVTSPMKYFNFSNLDFNLTYRMSPKMKLKFKAYSMYYQDAIRYTEHNIHDAIGIYSWGGGVWIRFFGYKEKMDFGQAVTFTHTLSANTFYEVFVSHMRNQKISDEMDQGYPDSREWWIPQIPPVSRFVFPWGDNYSENNQDGDQQQFRYRVDVTSQIDPHNQVRFGSEGYIWNGYAFSGNTNTNFADAGWNASAYKFTPKYFSGYVQDKMEYGGMIANLGVRIDYYDANKDVPANIHDPIYIISNNVRGSSAKVDNKKYTKISPRIGFSHPVSENTALHFQYGHFYQAPEIILVNNYGTYSGGYQDYPNPNLMPGKTVSYEFGIQHNLMGSHRLNVVAYFNDLTDQPRAVWYYMPNVGSSTNAYSSRVYQNAGYGTSKGFEASVDRTAVGKWYYRFTYTLARVYTGNQGATNIYSSDPLDPRNWQNRFSARTSLRGTDRSHRITAILSFRSPQEWGSIWGNWDLGMNVMVQSGTPYTYTTNYEESQSLVNNRRRPFEQQTDLNIRKYIPVGRMRPMVFLRVSNLFNSQWTRMFATTDGARWTQYQSLWSDVNHPSYASNNFLWMYNEARRVFLGAGINF